MSVFDVAKCRVCGCTDDDCSECIERTGKPCHWVEEDLCSACADDWLFAEVIMLTLAEGRISISMIQRRMSIGYRRASYLMEQLLENRIAGGLISTGASLRHTVPMDGWVLPIVRLREDFEEDRS